MREVLERILELQPEYSSLNTEAMRERGVLVRSDAVEWLNGLRSDISRSMGVPLEDLLIEGRDGTGRKTRVPWVRFGSRSLSPSATGGFYVVYLFGALGNKVHLSLNQGTTDFNGADFVPKPDGVIRARVEWAQDVLGSWADGRQSLSAGSLEDKSLGLGYEKGNVASISYTVGKVPSIDQLRLDAIEFASALGALYLANADGPLPAEIPEVEFANASAEAAAGKPLTPTAAGFRTNAAEIRAIEAHSMNLAQSFYERQGWTVQVKGKPYDLRISRDEEVLYVEVKGTTSDGSAVCLTFNEVNFQREHFPNNALIVVRNVSLEKGTDPPRASGGTLHELRGWEVQDSELQAISYRYSVPSKLFGS